MPTNPWVPGALVSFIFPGLGLLFLRREGLGRRGIAIFVAYVACMFAVPFALTLAASAAGAPALGWIGVPVRVVGLLFNLGSAIHTHDATCRLYPELGAPLVFKE